MSHLILLYPWGGERYILTHFFHLVLKVLYISAWLLELIMLLSGFKMMLL